MAHDSSDHVQLQSVALYSLLRLAAIISIFSTLVSVTVATFWWPGDLLVLLTAPAFTWETLPLIDYVIHIMVCVVVWVFIWVVTMQIVADLFYPKVPALHETATSIPSPAIKASMTTDQYQPVRGYRDEHERHLDL